MSEANRFRKKVVEAFNTSGRSNGKAWEPNKQNTLSQKKSSKPLIDSGDLRNSIAIVPRGPNVVFVGVPNKKRGQDGASLVDIASVHEFGRVIAIKVTPAMHRYVMAMFANQGGGSGGSGNFKPGSILVIKIPQRSFIRSTRKAHFKRAQVQRRAAALYKALLGISNAGKTRSVKPSNRWTSADEAWLKSNINRMSNTELGLKLGRSPAAISAKARRLGIKRVK